MDKKKTFNEKDFEYTIVMDASYISPGVNEFRKTEEGAEKADDPNADYELLYYDYERMILRDPTVLDKDDAYPHSYQWRMGDRYDPGKLAALEEALNNRTRITDTQAYKKYIEDMKDRRFKPESWD
ncbi:MAG: hypothetical protein IJJ06_02105 [Mogibacterium sp.]|nr:hypothetical protein [Mogibacterium sp.]